MYLFQGYIRIAKCSLALGDFIAAGNAISTAIELSPDNTAVLAEAKKLEVIRMYEEEGTKAYQKQDYRKVSIIKHCTNIPRMYIYL
jgi:hypothetical protein